MMGGVVFFSTYVRKHQLGHSIEQLARRVLSFLRKNQPFSIGKSAQNVRSFYGGSKNVTNFHH